MSIAQRPTFQVNIRRFIDFFRIIYGDIGTSIIMKAILVNTYINDVVLGGISAVFYSQTTIKYVLITLVPIII
jgi:K+ transporter